VTFSTGIAAGGNLAYWTSYLVTMVFTFITAAVIAEVCSASPSAGSIYLWAAEAGGPRFGRLLGFVVAWWSTTAWTTFCASMIWILRDSKGYSANLSTRQHPSGCQLYACCMSRCINISSTYTNTNNRSSRSSMSTFLRTLTVSNSVPFSGSAQRFSLPWRLS
jgi:amino acid transporter